ncbi:RHS repeat-associated core domain-containing protein [Silanimonas sp.]|jgi:RHS repeat-associated protein|uniref:RHS repeat-associated core domain-containing protein n=1 Tax=Silanimonas sp. TaxID=1929290 RepID=UPI0037C56D29
MKTLISRVAVAGFFALCAACSLAQTAPDDESIRGMWRATPLTNQHFESPERARQAVVALGGGLYEHAEVAREDDQPRVRGHRTLILESHPRDPIVVEDWTFKATCDPQPSSVRYATEEEAIAACPLPSGALQPHRPVGDWVAISWFPFQQESGWDSQQKRNYQYQNRHGLWPTNVVYKQRKIQCPWGAWPGGDPRGGNGWWNDIKQCQLRRIAQLEQLPSTMSCEHGNPCHVATGAKVDRETDVSLPWFEFQRTYHSIDSISGDFGDGWFSDILPRRLTFRYSSPSAVVLGTGRTIPLAGSANGDMSLPLQDGSDRSLIKVGTDWHLRDGQKTLVFDATGKLVREEQPGGALTFEYEPSLYFPRLSRIVHASGRALSFHYSEHQLRFWARSWMEPLAFTRLDGIKLDGVELVRYEYDRSLRLASVRWNDGHVRQYTYSDEQHGWNLKSISDNGVHFSRYQYESRTVQDLETFEYRQAETGRLLRSEHGDGLIVGEYSYSGGSTQAKDANGSVETYRFGTREQGRPVTAIEGGAGDRRFTYVNANNSARLSESVDAKSVATKYTHGSWKDQITGFYFWTTTTTEAFGTPQARTSTRVVDWRRGQTILLQEPGRETRTTYNANGWPTRIAVRDTATNAIRATDATYDAEGRLLTIDGPRTDVSDITTYTYFDAEDTACASSPTTCSFRKGDLKSVTNALGHTTHFLRYDGAGRLLESRDANGLVSTFTYTPRGWLASRTVGGLTTTITYTAVGDVESVTTPDGRSLTYTYDTARRLTAVRDQRGNRIDWTLDNAGNRTAEAVKDASGTLRRTLTQQFNTLGRLSQAANAAGRATLFTQDANGNLDLASDPLNRTTDQDVDALDRVTKQLQDVAGLNVETQFGYDALDQLTTVTDPKGLITRYTNDGLGNLLKLESPDTGTTTYTVDAAGNRSSQTDARGITVGYTYDALNRLTGISFPTAALNTSFVYDSATGCPAGETFALGRLSSMTDASGSTRWCYDLLGRLTRKVQVTNGRTFTTAYAYDAQGRLSTQTLPSGAIVKFGYTSGEVNTVAVRLAGSSVDLPLINGIERLPFGPVSKLTYGNGRTQTRAYDLDYAIDRITSSEASGWTQDYGVDAVGNITAILGTGANNRFRYDGLDRLTHADNTSNVTQRAYPVDKTGNRTGKQTAAGGAITPYVYAATNHRLASNGTEARTYDAVGNPLTIGTRTLTYDDRSRLTVFVNGSTTRRYQYTGQGLRVRKWTSSNTSGNTYFVYNENAQLIGEYDNAGARVQEIVWLGNLPIGVIAGTAAVPVLHYIESDNLGTPRVIVDATRNVGIWRWNQTNDPFGESTPNQNPDGDTTSFTFNLRFAGQYRDSESGWYYNVHRYYDPATGRYLESDPIGLGGGISTYSYVGAAPLTAVDPLGLQRVLPGAVPPPMIPPVTPELPEEGAAGIQNAGQQLSSAIRDLLRENDTRRRSYQTYTRFNPSTLKCYSGRTSGYGTPEENVKRRSLGQPHLTAQGYLPAVLDRSSESSWAIRGREQHLIVLHGGAQSSGGTSGNMINGISEWNPLGEFYTDAAYAEFGYPMRSAYNPCGCE